jgi:hypothetical protein
MAGTFVPTDTTWNHFQHFRHSFASHGLPLVPYTDGLSLFEHDSTAEGRDPSFEFQRALTALGIAHLVAPSPQAKGKIERRFGTFQKRLVTLLAFEKTTSYPHAQDLLAAELARQNRTVCRTTGLSPDDACAKARDENRSVLQTCLKPACSISVRPCIAAAGSMLASKLISSDEVGPSRQPPATPSPSATIRIPSSGWSINPRHPWKTAGQTSSENSPFEPVSFCSHTKSHFELPPTVNNESAGKTSKGCTADGGVSFDFCL